MPVAGDGHPGSVSFRGRPITTLEAATKFIARTLNRRPESAASWYARPGYLRRALEAGASGYLLKGRPSEDLADAVRRVGRGTRIGSPTGLREMERGEKSAHSL